MIRFAGIALVGIVLIFLPGCDSREQAPAPKVASPADPAADSDIEARVISIVANQMSLEKERVRPETRFVQDLGADSLDLVELIMELEETFDLSIPDDDAEKMSTVGQVVQYLRGRGARKGSGK